MEYTPTVWTNREVEKPRTYISTDNGDGTITLTPSEGTVFSAGTPIDATVMNKIENTLDLLTDRVQCGLIPATGDGDPTLIVDYTFPKAFSDIPIVVGVASISTLNVSVSLVTTTTVQFTVRHVDNGNWNSAISLRWIAILVG